MNKKQNSVNTSQKAVQNLKNKLCGVFGAVGCDPTTKFSTISVENKTCVCPGIH